jgi:hypothetical protein
MQIMRWRSVTATITTDTSCALNTLEERMHLEDPQAVDLEVDLPGTILDGAIPGSASFRKLDELLDRTSPDPSTES